MPVNRRQNGFTLLELLLSISLTALVLALMLSGLRLTEAAWLRGSDRLAAVQQTRAEEEAVQAQVSSAIPRLLTTQYQQRQVQLISFKGSAKEFRFLSSYSRQGTRNFGRWLVSYQVVRASDGKEQLLVSETGLEDEQQFPAFFLPDQLPSASRFAYGERASDIELSFLRPSSPGQTAAWVQEWKCDDRKQLPRGVRIHWQSEKQERDLTMVIPVWEEGQ